MTSEWIERTEFKSNELKWIGVGMLLALLMLFAPINVHIVIAQEGANVELNVSSADEGVPPAPVLSAVQAEETAPQDAALSDSDRSSGEAVDVADQTLDSKTSSEIDSAAEFTEAATVLPVTEPFGVNTAEIAVAKDGQSSQPKTDSVRNLSVEPGARALLPVDRPAWVGAPPLLTETDHFIYVGSIPVSEHQDIDSTLDEPLVAAVRNYIDDELLQRRGAAQHMPVDAGYIRKNLIDAPEGYVAELSTSEGAMFQKWVTVRVTPEQRGQFVRWNKEAVQRERLGPLGVGLFFLLGSVALTHMVLRRWHGATQLPIVNHQTALQLPERGSGSLTWLWAILGVIILAPVLILFWFLGATSIRSTHTSPVPMEFHTSVSSPLSHFPSRNTFPSEIRIQSGSDSRAIIIND